MKRICCSILLLLTLSCECNIYENVQYPKLVVHNLLYADSGGNLYLKVVETSDNMGVAIEIFFDNVQINDSSVVPIRDVVDISSFRLIDDQQCFFRDKNFVYAYQKYPSENHPLRRLDLDQKEAKIVGNYIFDDESVYWFGTKLEDRVNIVRDSLVGLEIE